MVYDSMVHCRLYSSVAIIVYTLMLLMDYILDVIGLSNRTVSLWSIYYYDTVKHTVW